MSKLERIHIRGFKSIADAEIEVGDVNVCIGANGAGKSNLIDFLWLLSYLSAGSLGNFVRQRGGADILLRYGRKRTPEMELSLCFVNDDGSRTHYAATLTGSDDNLLYFSREEVGIQPTLDRAPEWERLGSGGDRESALARSTSKAAAQLRRYLDRCKVFHFHDTSATARLRGDVQVRDNQYVRADGGNLAAYLHRLRETSPPFYRRVLLTIRQIAPFLHDFDLTPNGETVALTWYDRSQDALLSPLQFSDGTLRAIALIATLLRPEQELPLLIALDEPELGLHPSALEVLLGLVERLRGGHQVILATQSTFVIDHMEPDDILVVTSREGGTGFSRLPTDELEAWLDEYSLGELWHKNVLGGRP